MTIKKKSHFKRDMNRRFCFFSSESLRKIYKSLFFETNLPYSLRLKAFILLSTLPKKSSLTQIRNRCSQSLRGRAIFSQFGISRIVFRNLAQKGMIMGVKKRNW